MRYLLSISILLTLAAAFAFADKVIVIPSANQLEKNNFKIDFSCEFNNNENSTLWTQWGVNDRLEIAYRNMKSSELDDINAFDAQYSLLPFIPGYIPGLSVGIRDIGDETEEGMGYYFIITHSIMLLGEDPPDRDFILHLGAGFRGMRGLLIGFELPITNNTTLYAEHDTINPNIAVEWIIDPKIKLRSEMINKRPRIGLQVQYKF